MVSSYGRGRQRATLRGPEVPPALNAVEVMEVETELGGIYLHAADAVMTPLIRRDGRWEADECAFLRSVLRTGNTFLDVGANVGYMSVLAGRAVGHGGRVLALEPEHRNLNLLRANLWRHRVPGRVIPCAAYSFSGYLRLVPSEVNRGDHRVFEGLSGGRLVPCARLDDLLEATRIDVAKIDTQGADHEVIVGMPRLIAANPGMVILTEFWLTGLEERDVDPAATLDAYRGLGFTISMLADGGMPRRASNRDVIAACEAWDGRFVNLVLTRN
jgi:FkbM family methyltransferase